MKGFKTDGILTEEELASLPGVPTAQRVAQGPVAYIECAEQFPCNPCEAGCPHGAIEIGHPITNLPRLIGEKCIGCGLCIARCPGQAIFVVDAGFSPTKALVSLPYELLPVPAAGDRVAVLDRAGRTIEWSRVIRVTEKAAYDKTTVVAIAVSHAYALQARGVRFTEGKEVSRWQKSVQA